MTASPKVLKCSEQCQYDYTSENFVRKRAVSQIDRKQLGTKRDLDRFYVNSVLQDQTALEESRLKIIVTMTVLRYEYFSSRVYTKMKTMKIIGADLNLSRHQSYAISRTVTVTDSRD